jgi:hypothetical protein
LYGHETWPQRLREKHRLRVFENRVLKKICVPKRDKMMEDRRKLNSEEFNNFSSSPSIIRIIKLRGIRWTAHITRMVKREMHGGFWW